MITLPQKGDSLQEELRLHSRYIRDKLVPLLAKQPKLNHSDTVCLRAIFKVLDGVTMTLELLRFSRIEKGLKVIAAPGNTSWPLDLHTRATGLLSKWEEELGPLKNIRADLFGPGGRMHGVRKIMWKDGQVPDDVWRCSIRVRCVNDDCAGGKISMVCGGLSGSVSSPCVWPSRL